MKIDEVIASAPKPSLWGRAVWSHRDVGSLHRLWAPKCPTTETWRDLGTRNYAFAKMNMKSGNHVEIMFASNPHLHQHHSNKTCSVSKLHGSPRGGIHFRFTVDIEVFQVCNIRSQGYLHIHHSENSRVPRWIFLWTENADQLRMSLELYYSLFRLSFGRTLSDSNNCMIFMLRVLRFMSKMKIC